MQMIWTDRALHDLKHIRAYIRQHNPQAASTIAGRIIQSAEALADFPYIGRQGRVHGTRELVITNTTYTAVFRIVETRVEILHILHQAQNWGDPPEG